MKKRILLFATFLFTGVVFAQTAESPSTDGTQSVVQTRLELKRFDQKKWKEIVGDEDYSETVKKRKPRNASNGDLSKDQNEKRLKSSEPDDDDGFEFSSGSIPINPTILKIIFYALTIGFISYILFLILKNTSFKWNSKIKKKESADPSLTVTDIKELEIDRLLREAISSGNYRLAVRICFLGLLNRLDEDGFIAWKKDKTNRDYLYELVAKETYFEEVKKLTLSYEQVWYGDHAFSVQSYEEIIASFRSIDEKLNALRASED